VGVLKYSGGLFSHRGRGNRAAPLLFVAIVMFSMVASAASAGPTLFKVVAGQSTVYLFGTDHILGPRDAWFSKNIELALGQSRDLWLETLPPDKAAVAAYMVKNGISSTDRLSLRLHGKDLELLRRAVTVHGFPPKLIDRLQPWAAAVLLPKQERSEDVSFGAESVLLQSASADHTPVKAFETFDEGMHQLSDLPVDAQLRLLRDTLQAYDDSAGGNEASDASGSRKLWLRGAFYSPDSNHLEQLKKRSPELYDVLITKRNAKWTVAIRHLLGESGTHFVAVGAAHLSGRDGLISLLKSQGFRVTES